MPPEDRRAMPSSRRRSFAASVAALAALALALHAPALRGEAVPGWGLVGHWPDWQRAPGPWPNVLADYDPVLLELPEALHARRSGGARWNPLLGLGEPCGVASWPALDYPPAWLAYRHLPPWAATALLSFLHVLLGGVCALLYLRWRGHGARAALLAALAYELSPLFTAWLARPWISAALPFGALTLWAAEALARRPGPRPAAGLALATGGLALGAFPQLWLLTAALAPPLAAAAAAPGRRARALGLALAGVALGGCLAAPRLLPLSALQGASSRAPIPVSEWLDRTVRLEPAHLLRAVAPDLGGHPARGVGGARTPYENVQELRLYLGLPVLALALAGVGRARTWPFALLTVGAVALAAPPLAYGLWALAPGFKGTSPARVLWVLPLLALPLVAAGADALARGERRVVRAAAVVALAALALALVQGARAPALLGPLGQGPFPGGAPPGVHLGPRGAWPGGPWMLAPTLGPLLLAAATLVAAAVAPARARLATAAVAALAAGDLLREAHVYTTSSPPGAYYPETPATRAAVAVAGSDRALVQPPLLPNVLAPHGVRAAGSYGSLHSGRYADLLAALGSPSPVRQFLEPSRLPPAWRDALAVRAVVTRGGDDPRRPDGLTLVHEGDERVWASATALPRARLHPPDAVVAVVDRRAALEAAGAAWLDPRRHVLLEQAAVAAAPAAAPPPPTPPPPTPAEVVVDDPERVVVRVDAPAGGVLVVADAFAPGWTCATADGAPLPLLPAQVALRGVPLPAGFRGEVVFAYATPRRGAGLALGAAALVALLTGGLAAARRPGPPRPRP
ncbi:MAG: hypothetical protein M9894_30790 [Planctomycetes bacterium]|nr:hypothetical protein [Planctomycetota bacterium]